MLQGLFVGYLLLWAIRLPKALRLIFSIFMAQHKELKESVGLETIDLIGAGAP